MASTSTTPREAGFAQPAEWAPHKACWLAWPSHEDLWEENIEPAREAFVSLCEAISGGERLEILVPDDEQEELAKAALSRFEPRFHRVPFGDIWLRDTAPIFVKSTRGELATVRFGFNGWGGKYVLEHDDQVAARIAAIAGVRAFEASWILEGGSIDIDGEGTCLTTRQCLLNPNRNPGLGEDAIARELASSLGIDKLVWLGDGLLNDHTDGHVDNVARFVAPGVVVCMEARTGDDPNRDALHGIAGDLAAASDAKGRKLEVVRIPSPGRVTDEDGRVIPASFVNFYIGNRAVVVPVYGTPWDDEAATRIGAFFPGRRVVPVNARAVLSGGGAFHCISQQEPA